MPKYSLSEIDALCKKAVRGAGYSWGIAEEVGKSVRWLSAYGFNGTEALAQYLLSVSNQKKAYLPLLSKETDDDLFFGNNRGQLCALSCGAFINDLGYQINANKSLVFNQMMFPLLALSATGRIAEAYNISVSFKYDQTEIICDAIGISIKDTPPLFTSQNDLGNNAELRDFIIVSDADITCSRVQSSELNSHFPSPKSREISLEVLSALEEFAHLTYAPATEESRLRGAG